MIAHLVRHGESNANIGLATKNHIEIELTPQGIAQAERLSQGWQSTPDLIIASAFRRAQQTAAPTRQRFSTVPVETWPVHEFTYLNPQRWNGTTPQARRPAVEAYWKLCKPDHRDSAETESFAQFLRRVEGVLSQLKELPEQAEVFVFTHQQFIQAMLLSVEMPCVDDFAKMSAFPAFAKSHPILNGSVTSIHLDKHTRA